MCAGLPVLDPGAARSGDVVEADGITNLFRSPSLLRLTPSPYSVATGRMPVCRGGLSRAVDNLSRVV